MTKEQLAEREYPVSNANGYDSKAKERAAFIKGLEHLPEFLQWVNESDVVYIDPDGTYYFFGESVENAKIIEIFLTEKYGSNEQR